MTSLEGKVAIVTGASRGIGRAIAEQLASDGAFVVINYSHSADEAQEVVAGVKAQGRRSPFKLIWKEGAKHISDGGRIVCISTALTVLSRANMSLYCGSKAAVEQFVRVLALGPRRITVNTVSLGATETEAYSQMGPEEAKKDAQMSFFGRLGTPKDVADVVTFVVSEEGRCYCTGGNRHGHDVTGQDAGRFSGDRRHNPA